MNKNELFLFSISLILNMYRELSAIDFLNMCLMAVFLGGGVGYRTGDISWLIDKGSQWVHVWRSWGQIQSPPRYGHSWCWDSEQLSRPGHTLTHTRWREDCWRHTSLRMAVKLGFVPERHFNVTILSCFTTMQYWIQPLCCWKMYLPVHFVYKKPQMGIGFFFCTNSIVYRYV